MKKKRKLTKTRVTTAAFLKAIRKADREAVPFFPSKKHKSKRDHKRLKGMRNILSAARE